MSKTILLNFTKLPDTMYGLHLESEAGGAPKQRCMSARKPLGVAAANQVSGWGEGPDGVGVNCIVPGRL